MRGAKPYAELQVTTNFSFLRGASHAEELVAQAKALGITAIGVADHNTLAGVVRAHVAAKDAGLKLLVGARLDLEDAPSLLCYPKDRAAYGRLCRLLSLGQGRAEKGKCILSLADVAEHSEGQIFIALAPEDWNWREVARQPAPLEADGAQILQFEKRRKKFPSPRPLRGEGEGRQQTPEQAAAPHALSAPHPNPLPVECRNGERELLESSLTRMKSALTSAPLYLAASHSYCGDDRARIAALAEIAERCGTPLVATNAVLYHAAHRRPLQDVLTCVREKTTINEAGLVLEANAERHLKRASEMARLFQGHEDAFARTLEIVDACQFSLDELVYEYPDEPVPPGVTPQVHLAALTWDGAAHRFPDGLPDKVKTTIERELALINDLDFAPYFLTVHDIVAFARARGILCQGRGSAANSVVCYCIGITAVNPTEVDLLFERFISEARREPPDIDVDFEHERREEVIQYIYARYGRNRAGLAATVISYRARSAVRDVGKAMGLSEDTVAALAGMVWGTRSGGVLPEKHIREAGLDPADPLLAAVIELTQELMGFPRHLSQHVGGFILTRGPLIEVVPVGNAAMADRTFIEWDKDDIAALGLLKIDVLALGMLTCIRKAFELLEKHHDLPMTLAKVPRDDPEVYDMLCRADSLGVFQVESRAQMNMLPRLKPRTFYDLVIEVAIVRPGPIQGDMVHPYLRRRDGVEPETYPAPSPDFGPPDELRQILGKTKGVPLFQEQAMRIAMDAAKFSDAEVNELRKAMATFRRRGTIGLLEEKMVSRMTARGYDQAFAQRCFNQIKGFGEYGFPESHAASFAHLVYVSSWLKCHYPAAFACALLNSQPMGFYAPAQIVRCAQEHGVEAREVDVNFSEWDSTLEGETGRGPALRIGLRQIDGVREVEIAKMSERRQGSAWKSIADIADRTGVNIATLEKLAAADAFRSMGLDRRQALWQVKALSNAPALPLFDWTATRADGAETDVQLPQMALSEHVVNDYQTLRLSLKAHPMHFLREAFRADLTLGAGDSPSSSRPPAPIRVISCNDVRTVKDGTYVRVAGVVLVRQRPGSAKGVVFMTIEDETGVANAVVWPKMLERYRKVVMTSRLILIEGRIQRHEDIIHIVSSKLEDKSDWLLRLSEWAADMPVPLANADEVKRPEPGSARGSHDVDKRLNPRFSREPKPQHPRPNHPRNVRIIPKSRDFH
jgi:error-prone DNA polymerase